MWTEEEKTKTDEREDKVGRASREYCDRLVPSLFLKVLIFPDQEREDK